MPDASLYDTVHLPRQLFAVHWPLFLKTEMIFHLKNAGQPLLFNIYINDLLLFIQNSDICNYADADDDDNIVLWV